MDSSQKVYALAYVIAILGLALFVVGLTLVSLWSSGPGMFLVFPYLVAIAGVGLIGIGVVVYRWEQKQVGTR